MENFAKNCKERNVYTDLFHYFIMAGIDEVDERHIKINNNENKSLSNFDTKELRRRHAKHVSSALGKDVNPNKPVKTNTTLRDKRVDWTKYISNEIYQQWLEEYFYFNEEVFNSNVEDQSWGKYDLEIKIYQIENKDEEDLTEEEIAFILKIYRPCA